MIQCHLDFIESLQLILMSDQVLKVCRKLISYKAYSNVLKPVVNAYAVEWLNFLK